MIGQHACHHRLGHRRGAQADARVMPALGAQFDLAAELVDAAHRVEDRAGRLDRQPADDVLAGRDAAQDATGMVGEEHRLAAPDAHLVGVLLAAHRRRRGTVADLDALHGIDAHQALGEVGIELVVDRIAQAGRHTGGHDLDHRADRAAALAHVVEIAFPALRRLAVGAPEGIVAGGVPVPVASIDLLRAELHDGAAHLDLGTQDLAGDGAGGDPHRRFARRLAAAAAIITHAVFLEVGVVGVARAELVLDLAVVAAALVDIVDVQRDRRAGRDALEHAGQDFHGVRLLALRHEARLAGAALLHPDLDVGFAQGNARRRAVDHAADRRPVAFAPAGEPEEGAETAAGHDRPPLLAFEVAEQFGDLLRGRGLDHADDVVAGVDVQHFTGHAGAEVGQQ